MDYQSLLAKTALQYMQCSELQFSWAHTILRS